MKKSLDQVRRETADSGLRRALGPFQLIALGVGGIIGAGIYVLTGNAAATFAGPAIIISFVLAGLACTFTALCYAELAAAMPAAGSTYTYAHAALGERFAWLTGWLMVLELGVAVALVASGFSGYIGSLLSHAGVLIPPEWSTPLISSAHTASTVAFTATNQFNVVAALGVLAATGVLVMGVSASASINSVMVAIKVTLLLAFIALGIGHVVPEHWTPFIPANEGGFRYGWEGVFRAAAIIFFAYVGFESVSAAAGEAKNPQRDVPIGILGALALCTVVYMAVAAVLTGIVPYRQLGVPDPIAIAVDAMALPWFAVLVKFGAVLGLFTVMLTSMFSQTRIFFAMARDGLFPPMFARLHERHRTPHIATMTLGAIIAVAAGTLPIDILADLVSLGTALAFGTVAFTVMWLRVAQPDLPRPFRVPLGGLRVGRLWLGLVPVLAIGFCALMVVMLALDITTKATTGNLLPAGILAGYLSLGAAIYLGYGRRRARATRLARNPGP